MRLQILSHPRLLRHDPGPTIAESPARLDAIWTRLADLSADLPPVQTCQRQAQVADLRMAHADAYITRVLALADTPTAVALEADTLIGPSSVEAALRAAGIALHAAHLALHASEPSAVLALIRPPGHHATRDAAMGYCVFNNVALAALSAHRSGRRVAIFDLDAHHGNGTEAIVSGTEGILLLDIHQAGLYPTDTGATGEAGGVINVAVPPAAGDGDYLYLLEQLVIPRLVAFQPDVLLVSAGFDAHFGDPEADLAVTTQGFAAMAARLAKWAEQAHVSQAWLLEGGYAVGTLARNVEAVARALIDPDSVPAHTVTPAPTVEALVALLRPEST